MNVSASGLGEQTADLRGELVAAFERVLDSAWYVLGTEVSAFESEFAGWVGVEHAVGVASGTDALQLALAALDIGPGDEVIIPANALPTAYGVAASGATVLFADARLADLNIDPQDVAALITPRTRAVVAVHLYGHPAAVDELRAVVGDRPIAIIEDCAQAHGAATDGRRVGTMGDIAAWSFYPTKNLGAYGDGGAVTCNDAKLAERVRALRVYGEERRYFSTSLGVNSRLDEVQAALLRVKLPRLDSWVARRQAVAAIYDAQLDGVVKLPPVLDGTTHARHLYPIRSDARAALQEALAAAGVPVAIHYPVGAHDQPCFAAIRQRDLPVTEQLCASVLSLPMHPFITDAEAEHVAQAVRQACLATSAR